MSKVLTFSRVFPSYHPRKGEPTYFVEKIWNSLWLNGKRDIDYKMVCDLNPDKDIWDYWRKMERLEQNPKHHTIRAGHRWKVGDKFSPRVWSRKPYQSKQIIIAPDIEVKKVWDFKINVDDDYVLMTIDDWSLFEENMTFQSHFDALEELAKNDGLTSDDFKSWFKYPSNFDGQIICWNDKIEY